MKEQKLEDITIEDLLLNIGLYTPINICANDLEKLEKLTRVILANHYTDIEEQYNAKLKIDAYCPKCDKNSTFIRYYTEQEIKRAGSIKGVSRADGGFNGPFKNDLYEDYVCNNKYINMYFACSRNPKHKIIFDFYIDDKKNKLYKIGQYPSFADLNNYEIYKYKKILGEYYSEYKRAIGLFSHGIGAGSYVYLRRIFENLIEKIHLEIKSVEKWDEDREREYQKSHMDEKIEKIKDRVPELLFNSRKQIYRILSKGIHQLSEDECLKYFPILKTAIMLVLETEYHMKSKNKLTEDLTKSLNDISSDLSK